MANPLSSENVPDEEPFDEEPFDEGPPDEEPPDEEDSDEDSVFVPSDEEDSEDSDEEDDDEDDDEDGDNYDDTHPESGFRPLGTPAFPRQTLPPERYDGSQYLPGSNNGHTRGRKIDRPDGLCPKRRRV